MRYRVSRIVTMSVFALLLISVSALPAQDGKDASSVSDKLSAALKGEDNAAFAKVLADCQGKLSKGGPEAETMARQLLEKPEGVVPDEAPRQFLKGMAGADKSIAAGELLLRIAQSRRTVHEFKRGHVVVGQLIVADGKVEPDLVMGQMPISPEGYFAGEVGDLKRPIAFRSHGYQNLDVPLEGKQGDVVCLGKLTLKRIPADQQSSIKGKLVLDAAKTPEAAEVKISTNVGPINTPHNGYSPRRRWPEGITIPVAANGEFTLSGLSPCGYFIQITAKDHVNQFKTVNFSPGKEMDVGVYRLYSTDLGFYVGKPAPKNGELTWEKDYTTALKRAQTEKKPLMVMMTATWCGPCKKLEKETLSDAWTRHFLSQFVLVKAYEDKDVEKTYGLTGYPTLVFTDSTGKAAHKTVGYQQVLPFAAECARAYRKLALKPPADLQTLIEKKVVAAD
jgi:thiol-disulfide isomerase/thioredoxin